jgi:hypothetical protein
VVGDADRGDDPGLALVQHGFAMVWPPELPPNCRIRYLQAEQQARRSMRGRWAVAELGLHDAGDGARVALKAGEVIVMQGKVCMLARRVRQAISISARVRSGPARS